MGMMSRMLVVAGAMSLVVVFALVATVVFGFLDFQLVLIAFVSCLVAAIVAHVACEFPTGPEYLMLRMVGSMGARTSLPLVVCLLAKFTSLFPFEPGFVFLVLLFYFVGLVVDVGLQARRLGSS